MLVLVTGAAGYIGSHTCLELLRGGFDIVALDNLYNAKRECVERVMELSGKTFPFFAADILDRKALDAVFKAHKIDAVMHFAGLKAVGESVVKPLEYYHNNLTGTLTLCSVMRDNGVKSIVFSSSATVYGGEHTPPYTEDMRTGGCTNPYGQTKFMQELILRDLQTADSDWRIAILRYFNPLGADESGRLGEDPNGIPNNLMPYITQVAVGKLPKLYVFGDDYDTPDGTGVRDYIHVTDLARGHIKALRKITEGGGVYVYNLGTGRGTSVLELVRAFEEASGVKIPLEITARREGDIAVSVADVEKARSELGFAAEYDIARMCADSWRWQMHNPDGMSVSNTRD